MPAAAAADSSDQEVLVRDKGQVRCGKSPCPEPRTAPCTRINHSYNPNVFVVRRFVRVEGTPSLATGNLLKANKNICGNVEELFWDYRPNYPTNFA